MRNVQIILISFVTLIGCNDSTTTSENPLIADSTETIVTSDDHTPTDEPALAAKTFRDLVMEQRPASLDQIEFAEGFLFSLDWTAVQFNLYSEPDSTSKIVLKKAIGDASLFATDSSTDAETDAKPDVVVCEFAAASLDDACEQFFTAGSDEDLPIIYSTEFDDLVYGIDQNKMWFHTSIGEYAGWLSTPYSYSSDDPYPFPNIRSINTHDFVLWEPTFDSLRMYFRSPVDSVTGNSSMSNPKSLASQPLADNMSALELELHLDSEIYWFNDTPYLQGYLASAQTWEVFCQQSSPPIRSASGFVPMFDDNGALSVSEVDLGHGYCD